MTCGIIQVESIGSEDLYLVGNPKITFFKLVYRRHTNFGIETVRQNFIKDLNFDTESDSYLEKIGDLISTIFLKIQIPEINLTKNQEYWKYDRISAYENYITMSNIFTYLKQYLDTNITQIKKIKKILQIDNIDTSNLIDFINFEEIKNLELQLLNLINQNALFFENINDINFHIRHINIKNILLENDINFFFENYFKNSKILYDMIYAKYFNTKKIYYDIIDNKYVERYKSAWVNNLGVSIIEYADVKINNKIIDHHTGDWMSVSNYLKIDKFNQKHFFEMIGNYDDYVSYDDNIKPQRYIYIPLQFWFCNNYSQALPIVALKSDKININIKLRNLYDVAYFEKNNDNENYDIQSQYNINLGEVELLVDYIYLSDRERKRFMKKSQEYLIETVQTRQYNIAYNKKINIKCDFVHAVKYLVWFIQPDFYRRNPDGSRKCLWNKYDSLENKNFVKSMYLKINGIKLTQSNIGVMYYNYVQPYNYFNNTPPQGEYCYSFSYKPTDQQPSGVVDLGRIKNFEICFELNDIEDPFNYRDDIELSINVFAVSYNILRIMNGMAALAFERVI